MKHCCKLGFAEVDLILCDNVLTPVNNCAFIDVLNNGVTDLMISSGVDNIPVILQNATSELRNKHDLSFL